MTVRPQPKDVGLGGWLLVEHAAPLVGMSEWTFREACRRGEIPNRRLPGRRRILVPRDELEEYLNGATVYIKKLPRGGRVATTRRPAATSRA